RHRAGPGRRSDHPAAARPAARESNRRENARPPWPVLGSSRWFRLWTTPWMRRPASGMRTRARGSSARPRPGLEGHRRRFGIRSKAKPPRALIGLRTRLRVLDDWRDRTDIAGVLRGGAA